MTSITKRLGLLHIAPEVGELDRNRLTIERGTQQAAAIGAEWIISGELVVSGYAFDEEIGTTWVEPQPDPLPVKGTRTFGEVSRQRR